MFGIAGRGVIRYQGSIVGSSMRAYPVDTYSHCIWGRFRSLRRRERFPGWKYDLHVDARWYSRGHDLSRITLSNSHVPDVGEHGERNHAIFVKALDLVGVCANRIGKHQ